MKMIQKSVVFILGQMLCIAYSDMLLTEGYNNKTKWGFMQILYQIKKYRAQSNAAFNLHRKWEVETWNNIMFDLCVFNILRLSFLATS